MRPPDAGSCPSSIVNVTAEGGSGAPRAENPDFRCPIGLRLILAPLQSAPRLPPQPSCPAAHPQGCRHGRSLLTTGQSNYSQTGRIKPEKMSFLQRQRQIWGLTLEEKPVGEW